MIDIERTCRICLGNGAVYNIFKTINSDNIHSKLVLCFNEKIENIVGYPYNMCLKCKETVNLICEFRSKYQESRKILESQLAEVKVEFDSDIEVYEEYLPQILTKKPCHEPEVKQPAELLESLKEITIKKVNVIVETVLMDSDKNKKNIKSKLSKPMKTNQNKVKKLRNNLKRISTASKKTVCKNITQSCDKKVNNKQKTSNKVKDGNVQNDKLEAKDLIEKSTTDRLCDICGETFTKYLDLLNHKRSHKPPSYKCDKCPDRVYNSKGSLTEHISRVHDKIINAICDTCGKEFYGQKDLLAHMRVVHLKIRRKIVKKYNCRFCERSYHYKRGIVIHERSTHTGERPAVCSVCNAAFYDEVYLREHTRLHTGDVPYKCPICWRGYAQRCNMKSHMKNHKISEMTPEVLSKLKPSYLKFLRP